MEIESMSLVKVPCLTHNQPISQVCTNPFCERRYLCAQCSKEHEQHACTVPINEFLRSNAHIQQLCSARGQLLQLEKRFESLQLQLFHKKQLISADFDASFHNIQERIKRYLEKLYEDTTKSNEQVFHSLQIQMSSYKFNIEQQKAKLDKILQ